MFQKRPNYMSIKRHANERMLLVCRWRLQLSTAYATNHSSIIHHFNCAQKAMHQTFQKDLFRFRLKTAKLFLSSLKASTMPVSTNPNEPLKLNAQVDKKTLKYVWLLLKMFHLIIQHNKTKYYKGARHWTKLQTNSESAEYIELDRSFS